MKERPILFSGPMVRAILEGHKTMTRRVMKTQYVNVDKLDRYTEEMQLRHCPYGQLGDRLWVRETWAPHDDLAVQSRDEGMIYFRADDEQKYSTDGKWRPSIFMPRWASRITLELTDVRVERLKEISELDAEAEGAMEWWNSLTRSQQEQIYSGGRGPCGAFRDLWDSINAKRGYGWEKNPFVWALTFKRIEG
jgi:hypothetical protein